MKKLFYLACCLLLLCGCSAQNAAPSMAESSDTPKLTQSESAALQAETNTPPESGELEIIQAWDVLDTAPLHVDGSWSYYCAAVSTPKGENTILVRDNPKGDSEILLTVERPSIYITYIENSLQQSGGKWLYFTVPAEITGQNELYGFQLEENNLTQLLPAPCSNMIVQADPPNALSGFGWLLYEDRVVGIDLAVGQPYQGSRLESDLDGHFFYGIGAGFDTKYTVVEAVESDVLTLKTVQYDSSTSVPEQVTRLYYSVSSEQYTTEPSGNFAPPNTPVPPASGKGNGSCAASGCGAAAKYGRVCVDHVCMVNGCFDERYPGDRYCATHSNLVEDTPEYACAWPGCTTRAKYAKYCSAHVCRYVTCTNPKLEDNKYCDYHAQSNLCKQSGCYNFVDGGGYCKEH